MAHVSADRVRETTSTVSTGTLTLEGAVDGFRAFSAVMGGTDTCFYTVVHRSANEWEVGLGTFNGGLERTTVLSSTNGGALVNLSAGTKDVFITIPASRNVQLAPDLGLRLPVASTTPVAPVGEVALFGRAAAGRLLPAFVGPSGLDSILQAGLARNKIGYILPNGNGTTVSLLGLPISSTGTATALNVSTTNLYSSMRGIEYLVTAAATTAVAGARTAAAQFWRGNAPGLGGFFVVIRWGPATGVATTTTRAFAGLRNATAAPTDVEPSSLANIIGMGWDAADTNIQFMTNDGTAGVVNKIDLGSTLPVPTSGDRTHVYEVTIFAPPNGSAINYQVTNLVTGASVSGSTSTQLPSNTTFMTWHACMSVGGTSSVIGVGLFSVYIETDY